MHEQGEKRSQASVVSLPKHQRTPIAYFCRQTYWNTPLNDFVNTESNVADLMILKRLFYIPVESFAAHLSSDAAGFQTELGSL